MPKKKCCPHPPLLSKLDFCEAAFPWKHKSSQAVKSVHNSSKTVVQKKRLGERKQEPTIIFLVSTETLYSTCLIHPVKLKRGSVNIWDDANISLIASTAETGEEGHPSGTLPTNGRNLTRGALQNQFMIQSKRTLQLH